MLTFAVFFFLAMIAFAIVAIIIVGLGSILLGVLDTLESALCSVDSQLFKNKSPKGKILKLKDKTNDYSFENPPDWYLTQLKDSHKH